MSNYWFTFSELSLIVKWPENILMSQFEQGLKHEIKIHMIQQEFKSVEEMSQFAIKVDNKLNNCYQSLTMPTGPLSTPIADPDAMDCSAY